MSAPIDRRPGRWPWRTGRPHVTGESETQLYEQTDHGDHLIGELVGSEFAMWCCAAREAITERQVHIAYEVADAAADRFRNHLAAQLGLESHGGDDDLLARLHAELVRVRGSARRTV